MAWRLLKDYQAAIQRRFNNPNDLSGDSIITKYTIAFVAVAALSASAFADDVYRGLASGNPDLNNGHSVDQIVGVQPGVGTSFDVYRGLAKGNPDLFQRREATSDSGSRPDIYQGYKGNPDLRY